MEIWRLGVEDVWSSRGILGWYQRWQWGFIKWWSLANIFQCCPRAEGRHHWKIWPARQLWLLWSRQSCKFTMSFMLLLWFYSLFTITFFTSGRVRCRRQGQSEWWLTSCKTWLSSIKKNPPSKKIYSVTWIKFSNNITPLALVAKLATRWRHLH